MSLYNSECKKIILALKDSFNYTETIAKFLSEQIIKNNKNDPESILKILKESTSTHKNQDVVMTWVPYNFIDQTGQVTANTNGILTKPTKLDANKLNWLNFTKDSSGKLFLGDPDIGVINSEYIITSGYGVRDQNKKFYGTISAGVKILKLQNKISKYLSSDTIKFIVFNQNNKVVMQSDYHIDEEYTIKFLKKLSNNSFITKGNILDISEEAAGAKYFVVQTIDDYGYRVLVGENNAIIVNEFLRKLLPEVFKTILLTLFFITLLYRFKRNIIKPIDEISHQTLLLAQGDYNIEIAKQFSKEANVLANSINLVKNAYNTQYNFQLMLEKRALERTAELEKELNLRTDFFNNMSHEIRTPVHGFSAISDGLVSHWKNFDDEKKFSLSKQIADNAKRVAELLNNVLDFSRFNANKLIVDYLKINIIDLTKKIIEDCKAFYLNNRNIEINLTSKYESIFAEVDESKISQVIRELFTNAIKYIPDKGNIKCEIDIVSDYNARERLYFKICDTGIGIPEEELESIFDIFKQSTRTKSNIKGTGLGLCLAKKIINLHKGKIWATHNQNVGSCFHFTIPLNQSGPIFIPEEDEMKIDFIKNKNQNSINILMIDDEDACLESMELLLMETGFNFVKAKGGTEGLKYIKSSENIIDLILLDLMMPDVYGLNVLEELKKDTKFNNIPVILQTGTSDQAEIAQAFSMGVIGYLKKPYNKQQVINEIKKSLKLI